ncbi:MAG: DUF177 domain-containing protein [Alphaproteobacteria bacterium]|nr:DUF177 domain-containing protein [Alphaproteobacteria bacterium]
MSTQPPFASHFDLATLPEKGAELKLTPSLVERAAIAAWLDIPGIENLTASIRLSRRGRDFYAYEAAFDADVVQTCVVTLEPVRAHLKGEFRRSFRIAPSAAAKRYEEGPGGEISLSETEDPDVLDDAMIDLAAPVLEELSLSLDPYPKAPGAKFEVPDEEDTPKESPFAVLKALKESKAPAKPASAKPKT